MRYMMRRFDEIYEMNDEIYEIYDEIYEIHI